MKKKKIDWWACGLKRKWKNKEIGSVEKRKNKEKR